MKKPFDPVVPVYQKILRDTVERPPSDAQIATPIVALLATYVARGVPETAAGLWNVFKHALDLGVYTGGMSSFVVALFDLESLYEAPAGGFAQGDGSIERAPWRSGHEAPPAEACAL